MRHRIISRQIVFFLADILLVNIAIFTALMLRFEGQIPVTYINYFHQTVPLFTFLRITVFYFAGLYRNLWKYASVRELLHIVVAVSCGTFVVYLAAVLLRTPFPRSVYIISWLLQLALIGGSRLAMRVLQNFKYKNANGCHKKVLIIGAGEAGAAVVGELKKPRDNFSYKPVAFIDDNPEKKGKCLRGIRIFGGREVLPEVMADLAVDEVIIAIPSVPNRVVREIMDMCKEFSVRPKILTGVYEAIQGNDNTMAVREIKIEDLLGRESVKQNMTEIASYLEGKTVLVTGGGGSIGSELCRQVMKYQPGRLLLFGHGENSIFNIYRELLQKHPEEEIIPLIGSVQDPARLEEVFSRYKPHVVFHAAAHKHVPLMEDNPKEAIKNNIFGTRNVAYAAHNHQVNHFVLVSTDKAVNPTSVMGATKRAAEMVVQAINTKSDTRFVVVRFGNVLGSRGSVVPLFREQIAAGGPVTVTHPDMTRYFMTIPEAVQLIIQAGAMGCQGEVYILDMGEPVRIADLASDLIRISGFEPGREIDIVYTGIRPGEKLFEETLTKQEYVITTRHKQIFVTKPNGLEGFREELRELNTILGMDDALFQNLVTKILDCERVQQHSMYSFNQLSNKYTGH